MEIKITYIGIDEQGNNTIWCGITPTNATITDKQMVLYPDDNKFLKNKETGELFTAICLSDEIQQSSFEEIDERNFNNDITN